MKITYFNLFLYKLFWTKIAHDGTIVAKTGAITRRKILHKTLHVKKSTLSGTYVYGLYYGGIVKFLRQK